MDEVGDFSADCILLRDGVEGSFGVEVRFGLGMWLEVLDVCVKCVQIFQYLWLRRKERLFSAKERVSHRWVLHVDVPWLTPS